MASVKKNLTKMDRRTHKLWKKAIIRSSFPVDEIASPPEFIMSPSTSLRINCFERAPRNNTEPLIPPQFKRSLENCQSQQTPNGQIEIRIDERHHYPSSHRNVCQDGAQCPAHRNKPGVNEHRLHIH